MSGQNTPLPIFSQAAIFDDHCDVRSHTHPGTELIYIADGICRVETPAEVFVCHPGDLLVIAPETSHNQMEEERVRTFFVTFVCGPAEFCSRTRKIAVGNDRWVRRLMEDICRLSQDTLYQLCPGVLSSLLLHITEVEKIQSGRTGIHPAVRAVIEIMERDFQKQLVFSELAADTHVSPSYLRALFLRDTHLSPQCYLQNYRMAHARKLLQNSYWEISEVARLSGYADANYFSRLFRKVHQCSPGEFRAISTTRPECFIRL